MTEMRRQLRSIGWDFVGSDRASETELTITGWVSGNHVPAGTNPLVAGTCTWSRIVVRPHRLPPPTRIRTQKINSDSESFYRHEDLVESAYEGTVSEILVQKCL